VRDVSLYAPNGRRLDLQSEHDEFRVGKIGDLYMSLLSECRSLGAEIRLDTRLQSIQTGDSDSTVHLLSNGSSFDVQARIVIGADGAQSRVAKELKLSENSRWIVGLERVYEKHKTQSDLPRFHCLIDPILAPGYIAWVVDDGEEVHVGVGGQPARFDPKVALQEFENWATKYVDFLPGNQIEQRGGRIPVGGLLPRIINQHGLLVGDAAGAVSPLTAGGLDPCMRLSRAAASIINEYLKTGCLEVLKQYNGNRFRRRFWKRLLLRQCLDCCRSRTLINLGWNGLDSHIGRAFARKIMFGRGSFPDILPPSSRG
jgi:flavin-dependent dehydrogenase